MGLDATARRRWFGAIILVLALVMLVLGETVLKGKMSDVAFLAYWLICFVCTALAIVVAFRDVKAVQHEVRSEQRILLESALKDIESEARSKQKRTKGNGNGRGR
jgi:protein-S-isoprenylcysteine O-methyltransferase Ste14